MLFPSEGEMLFNYRGCFWDRCEDLAFVGMGFFPPSFLFFIRFHSYLYYLEK